MRRMTVKKSTEEMNMTELAYNCMYAKDGWAWYRDYETDMDLRDFIRKYNVAAGGTPLSEDNDELGEELLDDLQYGIDYAPGRVALMYRLMWAFTDMREALMRYEDTGLTPDQIEALLEEQSNRNWIPVKERLPIPIETVLTSHEDGGIGYSYYSDEKGWFCANNDEANVTDVVAWMPLPGPYWTAD